jgi:hypothetical protein
MEKKPKKRKLSRVGWDTAAKSFGDLPRFEIDPILDDLDPEHTNSLAWKAKRADRASINLDIIASLSDIGMSFDLHGEEGCKLANILAAINRLAEDPEGRT